MLSQTIQIDMNILKKLTNLELQLQQQISKRELYYRNRKDEWQKSERGIQYFEKTDLLREALVDIQNARFSVEEFHTTSGN